MSSVAAAPGVTRGLGWYFLRLGALGFGGPIALVGAMHRDLVDQRGWISEEEYREGIALAQLSPGPLAAQLCFYIGYVRGGIVGASIAGLCFVLPSFLIVLALGWAYMLYQGLPWMQAVFYGVAAAVIGLISRSAWLLTKKTIGRDALLWGIYLLVALGTIVTGRELVGLILLGGFATWLWRAPPAWLRRTGTTMEASLLLQIAAFFAYAGSFVFGSGLAIVPFLHGGVVLQHGWLNERQFIDAVAVAFITPGPVVITTGFIGYLVAGLAGAVVAAGATFLPCFLLTVLPAPYFRKYAKRPALAAFVAGITAAATGAIAGSVVVLARAALIDGPTVVIALAALGTAVWIRKVPDPLIMLAAGSAGLLIHQG
jgi:chromate transporter